MNEREGEIGMNAGRERPSMRLRLLLLCGGLLAGLALAEVALRMAGFSNPSFYTPDRQLGWTFRPGAAGWYRQEGEAYVRINSEGFRDREHTIAKPPGTMRIAVMGGFDDGGPSGARGR